MYVRSWILAARPKTLCAAFIPVLVGTALAYAVQGSVLWEISFYALLAAIAIQIGTNLVNDALDFVKGADTNERLGPTRVTQSGLISAEKVLAAGVGCFAAALVFSIPLVYVGGIPLALIMLSSVICGYCYTGGPFPIAYNGLGELFVMIYFGFVAIGCVFYLQTGVITTAAYVAALQVGLLSTLMIAVNNLRDIAQDRLAQKNTLAACFGETFGRWEISLLVVTPFLLNLYWATVEAYYAVWLPLLTVPIGILILLGVWKNAPSHLYNRFLALSALLHLLFGSFLSLGLFLS